MDTSNSSNTEPTLTVVPIPVPGAFLEARVYGTGDESILLIHGGLGTPDYLAPLAKSLAISSRVITYDQRGSGNSYATNETYSLTYHLNDLELVRAACAPERSVHLFGHGWGCLLAQIYASQQPHRVRSLFLCNPIAGLGKDWSKAERAFHRRTRKLPFPVPSRQTIAIHGPKKMRDRATRKIAQRLISHETAFFPTGLKFAPPPITQDWLAGINGDAMRKTRRALLRASSLLLDPKREPGFPVTVLHGEHGILTDEEDQLRARFPLAAHTTLENTGRQPWQQNPALFLDILTKFLRTPVELPKNTTSEQSEQSEQPERSKAENIAFSLPSEPAL